MKVMETSRFDVKLKEFRVIEEGEMGKIQVVKDGLELQFSTIKVFSPFALKQGKIYHA
jgi:hypothetical protein